MLRTKIPLLISSAVLVLAIQVSTTFAQTTQIQCGVNAVAGGGDCNKPKSGDAGTTINDKIGTIVNILSSLVGVLAVVMIIVGGFRYITSGGDSNKVSGAKNTILYAIIGLVIVALAQIIVRFVIGKATSA